VTKRIALLFLSLSLLMPAVADAQSAIQIFIPPASGGFPQPVTTNNPLPVTLEGGGAGSNVTIAAPLGFAGAANSVAVNVQNSSPIFVTPTAITGIVATPASSTTITTGGTAQVVFPANSIGNQGTITNPLTATEPLFVCIVVAQVATTTASGTTFALAPGQTFTLPPSQVNVTVNAVTTGHVFSAMAF
jgi:hypothetical protein